MRKPVCDGTQSAAVRVSAGSASGVFGAAGRIPLDSGSRPVVQGMLYCKCPESSKVRQMSYYGLERKRGTQKFHCPVSGTGEECHRLCRVRQDAKRRIVLIKINEDKLRTFAASPKNTYRWKRLHKRRSALERINARVGRDF